MLLKKQQQFTITSSRNHTIRVTDGSVIIESKYVVSPITSGQSCNVGQVCKLICRTDSEVEFDECVNVTYAGDEKYHRYDFLISVLLSITSLDDKVVLDCASGPGIGTNKLHLQGSKVIGVDIDNEIVEQSKLDFPHLQMFCGNICSFKGIGDGSVDIFVSSETIEHLDSRETELAISEINRVIKADGLVVITVPEKEEICMSRRRVEVGGHKQYVSDKVLISFFTGYIVKYNNLFYKSTIDKGANRVLVFQRVS